MYMYNGGRSTCDVPATGKRFGISLAESASSHHVTNRGARIAEINEDI